MELSEMTHSLYLSAIVCTRNSKARIQETLISLNNQSLDKNFYEIIVVDNTSDDGTLEWLQSNMNNYGYKLFSEKQIGLSYARNCGIHNSKGGIIYFIDDDALVCAHHFEGLMEIFDQISPDVAGGPVHGLWESTPPEWLNSALWRNLSLVSWGNKARYLEWPERLIGTNFAFKRSIFEKYGYFDVSLGRKGDALIGGEDVALEHKISKGGGHIYYDPSLYVFHKVSNERMTHDYFYRRIYHYFLHAEDEIDLPQNNIIIRLFERLKSGLNSLFCLYGLYKGEKKIEKSFIKARHDALKARAKKTFR